MPKKLILTIMLALLYALPISSISGAIKLSSTSTDSVQAKKNKSKIMQEKKDEKITFRLNLEKKARVELDIYNAAGKCVATIKKIMPAGPGTLVWNCADVPQGNFQAKLKIDGKEKKTRISLVK